MGRGAPALKHQNLKYLQRHYDWYTPNQAISPDSITMHPKTLTIRLGIRLAYQCPLTGGFPFAPLNRAPIPSPRLLGVGLIGVVVDALDLRNRLADLPGFAPPHLLGHILPFLEEVDVGLPVAAAEPVEEREELPVVDLEPCVVERVARGAVYDGVVRQVLAVVGEDGPDIDADEERDAGELLQWDDKGEHVVEKGLREAVDGVEGVAREGHGVGMIHL